MISITSSSLSFTGMSRIAAATFQPTGLMSWSAETDFTGLSCDQKESARRDFLPPILYRRNYPIWRKAIRNQETLCRHAGRRTPEGNPPGQH
ncbi:hypothetical protein OUZ56_012791 [Daphnia magna]|uniref:Uncharacterized protein n=1 Tax=Daphnia magna TaxID=35525 RepID=A0ABQ9Z426_9CRUS|nr:hypothetical protein OUZ56_012791 [Daphnia magna]